MGDNKYNRYLNILKKNDENLYKASLDTLEKDNGCRSVVFTTSATVTGPVLFNYVSWIILDALEKKIERLYFLARDGFIMYEIAQKICKSYGINIECRYLYCSRIAWRLPQYHIQKEKCLNTIFANGMDVTLRKIFGRANLTDVEIYNVIKEIKLEPNMLDKCLNWKEILYFKNKFALCQIFLKYVYAHSKEAYRYTIGYLEQEGLFEDISYALVDAGWVGSLQESLECLLNSKKKSANSLCGYYFGMFNLPAGKTQERYYTYYFSKGSGLKKKIHFNNNLFECLCCSRDGMTISYAYKNKCYVPVFSSDSNINYKNWHVELQINTILSFVDNALKYIKMKKWLNKEQDKVTFLLFREFMVHPSLKEAEIYGDYKFSDDTSEKDTRNLAIVMTKKELRRNQVLYLLLNRLRIGYYKNPFIQSYWIDGTIVRSKQRGQSWDRWNAILYRIILYTLH